MAARQTSFRSLLSVVGAALIAVGFFLLSATLDAAATPVSRALGISIEARGMLPAVGLAALHTLEAYTFNHAGFLSSLRQILISFWPASLILIGLVVLRNAMAKSFSQYGADSESPSTGVRS